jgi:hypothetical protein
MDRSFKISQTVNIFSLFIIMFTLLSILQSEEKIAPLLTFISSVPVGIKPNENDAAQ